MVGMWNGCWAWETRVTGFGVVPDRSGFVIESRREGEREQCGWFELGGGLHG
jgi:hypothetical protein